MGHTPGPWHTVEYSGFWEIQDSPGYSPDGLFNEETCKNAKANAKLAAAAPELLEALKVLLAGLKKDVDMYSKDEKITLAELAIKKATD